MNAKIIRLSSSSSPIMFLTSVLLMYPFLLKRNKIFATSNVERREVLRKFAKSMREMLPDPSAILFVILRTAALPTSIFDLQRDLFCSTFSLDKKVGQHEQIHFGAEKAVERI